MAEQEKKRYIDMDDEEQAKVREDFKRKAKLWFKKWGLIVIFAILIFGMAFAWFGASFFGSD